MKFIFIPFIFSYVCAPSFFLFAFGPFFSLRCNEFPRAACRANLPLTEQRDLSHKKGIYLFTFSFSFHLLHWCMSSWEIYTIIGVTAVAFTSLYTALGKVVENSNDGTRMSAILSPAAARRRNRLRCDGCGGRGNIGRVNGRRRAPIPASRFVIQCYQLSLGISVPKLPQSTSTRY